MSDRKIPTECPAVLLQSWFLIFLIFLLIFASLLPNLRSLRSRQSLNQLQWFSGLLRAVAGAADPPIMSQIHRRSKKLRVQQKISRFFAPSFLLFCHNSFCNFQIPRPKLMSCHRWAQCASTNAYFGLIQLGTYIVISPRNFSDQQGKFWNCTYFSKLGRQFGTKSNVLHINRFPPLCCINWLPRQPDQIAEIAKKPQLLLLFIVY